MGHIGPKDPVILSKCDCWFKFGSDESRLQGSRLIAPGGQLVACEFGGNASPGGTNLTQPLQV